MTRLRQIMLDELQRRTVDDADNMAADFVRQLKSKGRNVTGASFTTGGIDDIWTDRHVLKAKVKYQLIEATPRLRARR